MIEVNKDKKNSINVIRHYIKDLSFENPQSINENNPVNNSNINFSQNMSLIYLPYRNNFFGIIMKCACEGSSKENESKLFVLELDYFGFFRVADNHKYNQADLTKIGGQLILPFVRTIIRDITNKGGSLSIDIPEVDFDLIKS